MKSFQRENIKKEPMNFGTKEITSEHKIEKKNKTISRFLNRNLASQDRVWIDQSTEKKLLTILCSANIFFK